MSEAKHDETAASGTVRAHGNGWAIAIPSVVVFALVSAAVNLAVRPSAEAHAATSDERTERDIRETRDDMKKLIERMGKLEDKTDNLGVSVDELRKELKAK